MPPSGLDPELSLDGVCVNPGSSADAPDFSAVTRVVSRHLTGAVRSGVGGSRRVRY